MKNIELQAQALAEQEYPYTVHEERRTDGSPCFVARHPDLPGCISDGNTQAEAIENLADARHLYILSLLEDGLPVPQPSRSPGAFIIRRVTGRFAVEVLPHRRVVQKSRVAEVRSSGVENVSVDVSLEALPAD